MRENNIEKIEHTKNSILLKLKNPVYNFYTRKTDFTISEKFTVRNFDGGLILANNAEACVNNYRNHLFPTVVGFDLNQNHKNKKENVFIYYFTGNYYHNVTELFPKLLKLKKIDPNFVFMIASWFNYYDATAGDYSPKYLIEFLDLFEIKYQFLYAEDLKEMAFEYGYIFYEKFEEKYDVLNEHWEKKLDINGYCHCQMYYTTEPVYAYESLQFMKNYINETSKKLKLKNKNNSYPKKIFISRKNFFTRKDLSVTSKENKEELIEEVFKNNGFTIVNMENHSFLEQLKLSYNAETIACFTGASILNAFYGPKKQKIFYINPLNLEYNNQPHLSKFYKFLLNSATIEHLDYNIDMNNPKLVDLEETIKNFN